MELITKPKAAAIHEKDGESLVAVSQEAPNLDEDKLRLQTQLLLVHYVVEPKSRITLEEASTRLGVPPEQLLPIVLQTVEGLDLVVEEYQGSFSVRHRNWKFRGMPEREG